MIWNLETIKHEIVAFAEHTKKTLGEEMDWVVEELVNCPIEISKRMTRTKGMFQFDYVRKGSEIVGIKPKKIKIAQYLLDNYHDADIIETIKHECVHLIVDVYKRKSNGHNKTFKQFCQMLGTSDETYFTAEPKKEITESSKLKVAPIRFVGVCVECGQVYTRKRMTKDTIHTWLYHSTCQCSGDLHIKDLKKEIVYIQNEYETLENTVSLDDFEKGMYKKNHTKTVEEYIEDAKNLGAYGYAEGLNVSEFSSELDCIWWDLCLVYDNDKDWLSRENVRALRKWLELAQPHTIEFKDVCI